MERSWFAASAILSPIVQFLWRGSFPTVVACSSPHHIRRDNSIIFISCKLQFDNKKYGWALCFSLLYLPMFPSRPREIRMFGYRCFHITCHSRLHFSDAMGINPVYRMVEQLPNVPYSSPALCCRVKLPIVGQMAPQHQTNKHEK